MDEERGNTSNVYKRAAIGMAVVALAWTAAILLAGKSEDDKLQWLIPIAAAVLSVICFTISTGSGSEKRE